MKVKPLQSDVICRAKKIKAHCTQKLRVGMAEMRATSADAEELQKWKNRTVKGTLQKISGE